MFKFSHFAKVSHLHKENVLSPSFVKTTQILILQKYSDKNALKIWSFAIFCLRIQRYFLYSIFCLVGSLMSGKGLLLSKVKSKAVLCLIQSLQPRGEGGCALTQFCPVQD